MKKLLLLVVALAAVLAAGTAFALVEEIPLEPGKLEWEMSGKVDWPDAIKIPSNAHKDDVLKKTGLAIRFEWDPKQKDDCKLIVDDSVFDDIDGIDGFSILVKNANTYHVARVEGPGSYDVLRTLYSHFEGILDPKFKGPAKNINWVEIGDFIWKIQEPTIHYVSGVTAEGAGIGIEALYGSNVGREPTEEYGKAVTAFPGDGNPYPPALWMDGIRTNNPGLFSNLMAISVDIEGRESPVLPEFVWNSMYSESYEEGELVRFEHKFMIEGEELLEGVPVHFYGACDNGFVLFVNKQYAGQTETVNNTYGELRALYDETKLLALFGVAPGNNILGEDALCEPRVQHGNWQTLYAFDITDFLIPNAENIIEVYAYNTANEHDPAAYPASAAYTQALNPSGLIYSFEVYSLTLGRPFRP